MDNINNQYSERVARLVAGAEDLRNRVLAFADSSVALASADVAVGQAQEGVVDQAAVYNSAQEEVAQNLASVQEASQSVSEIVEGIDLDALINNAEFSL